MAYLDDVLTQENFANQVDVVAQERSQRMDNVPYGTVFEKALPLIFDAEHPYGHLPIGNMAAPGRARRSTRSAPSTRRYYMPSNAVLSIVGDVDADDAFAKAATLLRAHRRRATRPKREIPPALPPLDRTAPLDIARTCRRRRSGSPLGCPSTRRTPASSRPSRSRPASSARARPAGCIGGSSARTRSALPRGLGHQHA